VSDARRNVRLYSTIKDRKSPLKRSQTSVPHGTNFCFQDQHKPFLIRFPTHTTQNVHPIMASCVVLVAVSNAWCILLENYKNFELSI